MSVQTFEGLVENGQIRLLDQATLPEKTRVYVVVPEASGKEPRLWSPRLADPAEAAQFEMQVRRYGAGDSDADV